MAWGDVSYHYKKKITIDYNKVDSDETDFPILVTVTDMDLGNVGSGGKVQNSSGYDIIFYDSTETVQLSHEIEAYDQYTGFIYFWVKINSISSTSNTIIYIYYSKSGVSTDPSTSATWDSKFVAVYHLDDSSATPLYLNDSTSNNNDGTDSEGTLSFQQIGISSGYGITTDNLDERIQLPSLITRTADFSLEVWMAVSDWWPNEDNAYAMGFNVYDDGSAAVASRESIDEVQFRWNIAAGAQTIVFSSLDLTNWHSYLMIYDNDGDAEAWYDGTSVGTNGNTGDLNDLGATYESNIGAVSVSTGDTRQEVSATYDEARISNEVRSDGWMVTTHETIKNPSTFFSMGEERTVKVAGDMFIDTTKKYGMEVYIDPESINLTELSQSTERMY